MKFFKKYVLLGLFIALGVFTLSSAFAQNGEVKIADITKSTYKQEVLDHKGIVLVDFWFMGCKPCVPVIKMLTKIAPDYAGKVKIVKFNAMATDESRAYAKELGVERYPTLYLYKNGVKQAVEIDPSKEEDVRAKLDALL